MSGEEAMETLRDSLVDWADADVAAYRLALVLGVLDPSAPAKAVKHVFWTSNELGEALQDVLRLLVRLGAVEYSAEEIKYRWNPQFEWKTVSKRR